MCLLPPMLVACSGPPTISPPTPPSAAAAALATIDAGVAERRAKIPAATDTSDATAVADELAARVEVDQWVRNAYDADSALPAGERKIVEAGLGERMRESDGENTWALKVLVTERGWPAASMYGEQAARDAWLLAQHADQDPAFQREVLGLMEPLVTKKEVRPEDYALLRDRVAVAEGKPQRYGSQGRCVADGDWTMHPVEDAARLDELRASVGLESSAVYDDSLDRHCVGFEP